MLTKSTHRDIGERVMTDEPRRNHTDLEQLELAVLIPCYNEEASIAKVVKDFQAVLPGATIYVYDNNSADRTIELAAAAGAVIGREPLQGKGNVVRRMFADVEADVYILVDGDDTYDAASAPKMIEELMTWSLDMINAARTTERVAAYRPGHRFGNILLSQIVAFIFGNRIKDMLSGYRCFSRRFVKSFPAVTGGFDIETELTVNALELRMPIAEVLTPYKERPQGSDSKLSTVKDGLIILKTIISLFSKDRPLYFFGLIFILLATGAMILAWPLFVTYFATGEVPRFPTAILVTGMMLLAFLSAACGLILDTVTRGRLELKRFHYLSLPPPPRLTKRRRSADSAEKEGSYKDGTVLAPEGLELN